MNDATHLAIIAKTIYLNKPDNITLDDYIAMMVRKQKIQKRDIDTVIKIYNQLYVKK